MLYDDTDFCRGRESFIHDCKLKPGQTVRDVSRLGDLKLRPQGVGAAATWTSNLSILMAKFPDRKATVKVIHGTMV